jgi:hypothetical protein
VARPDPDKLDLIIDLLTSLKQELNDLRTDFRAHDHGAAYTADSIRLAAAALTFSGTAEASAEVTDAVPSDLYEKL